MTTAVPVPRVLVIGLDPYRGPRALGPEAGRRAHQGRNGSIRRSRRRLTPCLFGLDGRDDMEAIVGGARARQTVGVRGDHLELFEQAINLVPQHARYRIQ